MPPSRFNFSAAFKEIQIPHDVVRGAFIEKEVEIVRRKMEVQSVVGRKKRSMRGERGMRKEQVKKRDVLKLK